MIYREPEMEIVELKLNDVICLSGGDGNGTDNHPEGGGDITDTEGQWPT